MDSIKTTLAPLMQKFRSIIFVKFMSWFAEDVLNEANWYFF